jgi:exonuclease SbcD
MKILHTSDWHLGKKLDNFPRHNEQVEVLEEICAIADHENVDAIIIAGDLFDAFNPPVESVELFYKTLKKMANNGQRAVICIAGNHDSPDRIEAPDPLARECGIIFAGNPNTEVPCFKLDSGLEVVHSDKGFIELKLPQSEMPLRLLITPYANEYRLKAFLGNENQEDELRNLLSKKWLEIADKYCDPLGVNMLVSHLFFVKNGAVLPEEPDDEKPILHVGGAQAIYSENIPHQIQYVALGHLHRMQTVDIVPCPAIYCGSPLSYSFSEANQKKYVMLLDANPGKEAVLKPLELKSGKRLLRYKAEGIQDAVDWLSNHQECLVELTIITDNFLNAADRKLLSQAHEGIIQIIPEVRLSGLSQSESGKVINLSKSMEELFAEYFRYAKGMPPDEQLMDLFREVLSVEPEEQKA